MRPAYFWLPLFFSLLLSACSPHPGAGVWSTSEDNVLGVSRLVVGFDGWANFETNKPVKASWRCFWSAVENQEVMMKCTSSLNPEYEEIYLLTVRGDDLAEFRHQSRLVASLTRLPENPSPGQ